MDSPHFFIDLLVTDFKYFMRPYIFYLLLDLGF